MGDGLFVHGGVTDAKEARLALAGLLALQGPGALDVRTGVLAGPGTATLVTGTSATAPMTVQIGVHDAVLSRGTANGPYLMATDLVQTVNIGAAPGSGTRVDVVYEKQGDATPTVPTPDGATAPIYGVLAGTVGAGKPSLAGIVGALELATVSVSAGATRTTDGTVVIAQTARQTAARGGIFPVRDQADRDAITAYPAIVHRLDTGAIEEHGLSGSWVTVYDPTIPALSALPRGRVASATFTADVAAIGATETMFDTVTFTAVAGRRYRLTWDGDWVVATAASTVQFNIRSAAGATVTSAGTLRRGRTATSWSVGNWTQQVLVAEITGLAAGQVTLGVGAQVVLGGGTVGIKGAAGNERTLIVEDIGV